MAFLFNTYLQMSATINSNTINWPILRGVTAELVINKASGWGVYDEILMDFKTKKDVNLDPVLRLSIGNGLSIDGNRLIISVSYEQSAELRVTTLYADIKVRIGENVFPPIPFVITVSDTVTKIPS